MHQLRESYGQLKAIRSKLVEAGGIAADIGIATRPAVEKQLDSQEKHDIRALHSDLVEARAGEIGIATRPAVEKRSQGKQDLTSLRSKFVEAGGLAGDTGSASRPAVEEQPLLQGKQDVTQELANDLAKEVRRHWQIREELKQQMAEEMQSSEHLMGEEFMTEQQVRLSQDITAEMHRRDCEVRQDTNNSLSSASKRMDVATECQTQCVSQGECQEPHVADLKSEYRALKQELARKHHMISRLRQIVVDQAATQQAVAETLRSELAEYKEMQQEPSRNPKSPRKECTPLPPVLPEAIPQTNRAKSLPPRLVPRKEHLVWPIKYVRFPEVATTPSASTRTPSSSGRLSSPWCGRHSPSPSTRSLHSSHSCSRSGSPTKHIRFDRLGSIPPSSSYSPTVGSCCVTPRLGSIPTSPSQSPSVGSRCVTPRRTPSIFDSLSPRKPPFPMTFPVIRGETLQVQPLHLGALPRVIDARLLNRAFVESCECE